MAATKENPREMTDEEVVRWMQELVAKLAEQKGSTGGACSLEAIRSPVRRRILNILEERALTIDEISERLRVTGSVLSYHLNFLKGSHFIRIEGDKVDLTPGGVSAVRSAKRT
jgi:DNA-binding transcriptional ArsR family regulator